MKSRINTTNDDFITNLKQRRDKADITDPYHSLIVSCGVGNVIMLFISVIVMSPDTGPLAMFKALLIASIAGLVAGSINFFGITRGAPFAALGYKLPGFASIFAILVAGNAMFIGSFNGLIYSSVEEIVLEESGAAVRQYISDIDIAVVSASRAGPAVRLIHDDLERYAVCERQSSCLSRVGNGGYGPVAAELQKRLTRAEGIASAFENGDIERQQHSIDLNQLYTRYQNKLTDTSVDMSDRRAALQGVHFEIEQMARVLAGTVPVSLLKNFQEELQRGVTFSSQSAASREVNNIYRQHANSLADILQPLDEEVITPPVFPPSPGMMDSLKYFSEFAAVGIVIFLAEEILPLLLWVMVFTKCRFEIDQIIGPKIKVNKPNDFGGLIDLSPRSSLDVNLEEDNNNYKSENQKRPH